MAHYTAVGQIQPTGIVLWCLNVLYFGSSVFYVKARVEQFLRSKSKHAGGYNSTVMTCVLYHGLLLLLLMDLVTLGVASTLSILAFLPIIVRGLCGIGRPDVRLNLKKIGVLEVAYSLFFALVIIWAIRAGTMSIFADEIIMK